MATATSGSILGVIHKESWILDHFEIFVTIAFNGPYTRSRCETVRWCHLANLAEVCGLWLLLSSYFFNRFKLNSHPRRRRDSTEQSWPSFQSWRRRIVLILLSLNS